MNKLGQSALFILVFLVLVVRSAIAASVTPIVGYVGTYSSNILRTSEDEQWEWINRPLIGFDVDHRGKSLNAYGHATAEYFDFIQGTAENETYYDINAIAEWNIISDRFLWYIEDYASITPIIISDPLTPLNVEQRNILTTGPTFRTRLGTRNQFDWELRYGNFFYSISDIDNQRLYSNLGVSRQIDSTSSLRLGYEYTRTIFREEVYQDYNRQDIGLTYSRLGLSANMELSGGFSYLDAEETDESIDGWFLTFGGSKRVSPRTSMNILLGSRLSDSGLASFGSGVNEVNPDVNVDQTDAFSGPIQAPTTDIFRLSELRFELANRQNILTTTFNIGYTQADYETDDLQDNFRLGADLRFEHPIRSYSLFSVYLASSRQEFPNQGSDTLLNDDGILGASISWRFFRRLNLVFDVSRYVRRSNEPERGYTESVAEMRLVYRPSGRALPTRQVRRGR